MAFVSYVLKVLLYEARSPMFPARRAKKYGLKMPSISTIFKKTSRTMFNLHKGNSCRSLFMRTHFDRQLGKPYLGLRARIQLLVRRMLRLSLGKKSESVKTEKKKNFYQ